MKSHRLVIKAKAALLLFCAVTFLTATVEDRLDVPDKIRRKRRRLENWPAAKAKDDETGTAVDHGLLTRTVPPPIQNCLPGLGGGNPANCLQPANFPE